MLKSFIRPFKDFDRRVKVAIAGSGLANYGNRGSSRYDPLYATDLGANAVDLGLLTSISQAFSSIIAIPMGWAVENYSVKKVWLFNLALYVVHLVIMIVAGNWFMLIPAYILSTRILRVTATQSQCRSTAVSLSRVVQNVAGIFAPLTAAFIVTYFGGMKAQGIRPLYFLELSLILSVFTLVFWKLPSTLGRVDERARFDKKHKSGSGWTDVIRGYGRALKGEKYLKRFVVLRAIQTFGQSLTMPFVTLFLVEAKGADPFLLGIIGSTSVIVTLILQIPAGHLADRIGRKKVYFLFQPLSWIGTFLAILAPGHEYLILAGLIGSTITGGGGGGGGLSGVGQVAFITFWWESVPEEKRGRFFGIEGLFSLAAIPASILGGILWQQGFMTAVLLVPILLEMGIAVPMLATIPDRARYRT
jgi:MFS family permease